MEQRELKVIFTKSGSGSISTKLSIPKKWVDKMGITQNEKGILAEFVEDKIIISKKPEVNIIVKEKKSHMEQSEEGK